MKLPAVSLSLEEKVAEFDSWITASIQQVTKTDTYRQELSKVSILLESLGAATNSFNSPEDCNAEKMAVYCVAEIENIISKQSTIHDALVEANGLVDSLVSMLFLVTGKSDNNNKCQFPVWLNTVEGKSSFPVVRSRLNGKVRFESQDLGRVIKQERICKLISDALVLASGYSGPIDLEAEATWLLKCYINSILDSEDSVEQLWVLGYSFFKLRSENPGFEKKLLSPIVAFKVRGSVAAQSGHLPEKILRRCMSMWGLKAGVDYNLDDVVIDAGGVQSEVLKSAATGLGEVSVGLQVVDDLKGDPTKTRAYDFVLPYNTPGWCQSVFIQAQFYAGDSGSVSHKVVDQTRSSRVLTRAKFPKALFVEYLDGAGYYSSLFRDLKHMLEMPSTFDFFQVRTVHTKLRRVLQACGFLTPLDFSHALMRAGYSYDNARTILLDEGYAEDEITRCFTHCLGEVLFAVKNSLIVIEPRLLVNSRRILLLDLVLIEGVCTPPKVGELNIFAPGGKANTHISLVSVAKFYEGVVGDSTSAVKRFTQDLSWLSSKSLVRVSAGR
ncbi:MAG: hypothetical protein P0Y58_12915 [Candidatus Pseudomonas phytovorans]|uniref:Uncharacterized protein n=1 Tax=Candidatus Pseudomonas phytovorans TaxID=3121377 RepID=A0AAJ5WLV9_9PSED|nr:hypothetical protein [Pseudomonas sp.]WEK33042.1 MAG: hypothetical protein P0Y58_12915 [Pseudomonas sp.]